jgi:hypothetical protein
VEWSERAPADVLYAGRAYTDVEASVGSEDTIASALIESAPACSFTIWQDPKYEYDGELVMYHPDLGRYSCGCDANGSVHVTANTVDAAVARCVNQDPDATAHHLAAELHHCFGVPWKAAFATCTQREIAPAQSPVAALTQAKPMQG